MPGIFFNRASIRVTGFINIKFGLYWHAPPEVRKKLEKKFLSRLQLSFYLQQFLLFNSIWCQLQSLFNILFIRISALSMTVFQLIVPAKSVLWLIASPIIINFKTEFYMMGTLVVKVACVVDIKLFFYGLILL